MHSIIFKCVKGVNEMKPPSYGKILAVGNEYIADLFKGDVEITEKIDGSFVAAGCTKDNHIVMRSKGKELFYEDHEGMFDIFCNFVL